MPPRSLTPTIPENLEAVIIRALGKLPTERYLTAQAMLDDLRRVPASEPAIAPAAFAQEATRVMSPAVVVATQPTEVRRRPPEEPGPALEPLAEGPPRRRSVWPWVLVIILILALAGGAYAILSSWDNTGADLGVVPRVVGVSEAEAKAKIEAAGFDFEKQGEEPSADVVKGDVARQDPEEGTKLAEGKTVGVWISSGWVPVEVPNVVGMTQVEAAAKIGASGLKVGEVQLVDSTLTGGTVVDQNPKEGQEVEPGATVILYVSNAPVPTTVKVPAVAGLGLTFAEAKAKLAVYSLRATVTYLETPDYKQGLVIGQNPVAGVEVQQNSYVELIVSKKAKPHPKRLGHREVDDHSDHPHRCRKRHHEELDQHAEAHRLERLDTRSRSRVDISTSHILAHEQAGGEADEKAGHGDHEHPDDAGQHCCEYRALWNVLLLELAARQEGTGRPTNADQQGSDARGCPGGGRAENPPPRDQRDEGHWAAGQHREDRSERGDGQENACHDGDYDVGGHTGTGVPLVLEEKEPTCGAPSTTWTQPHLSTVALLHHLAE